MSISNQTVEYLAKLARITLKGEEVSALAKELEDIVSFIDKLNNVNIDNIEPTSHVHNIKNVFREDEIKSSLDRDLSLENSPDSKQEFFKVFKVIE